MKRILFICHGNICRSPMAEFMMKKKIEDLGLKNDFFIASAATSDEEIWCGKGNPIYPPAKDELSSHEIGKTSYTDFHGKRAYQIKTSDYDKYDYLIVMDKNNIRNLSRMGLKDPSDKIHLLLDFTSRKGSDISDPWYTGDFKKTYQDIDEGLEGFLSYLTEKDKLCN